MNDVQALIEQLKNLGPDEIRARIEERDAEIKALRILLRAARQTQKAQEAAKDG